MDTNVDSTGGKGMTYQVAVPANSNAPGKKGATAADNAYFYICVADNTWRRVTLEAF